MTRREGGEKQPLLLKAQQQQQEQALGENSSGGSADDATEHNLTCSISRTIPPTYNSISRTPSKAVDPDDLHDEETQRQQSSLSLDSSFNLKLITICLCTGACLPSLDVSIVFTIMNEIGTEFHRAHLATWLHTSYAMSCLATLPLAGKLSDVFGRKYIMLLLVALFFVGSVGCGIATSMNQIIFSRVIAGFGGGGLQLMSNVVIQDLVTPQKRGQYQSYVSSVQTLGIALGSPLGGFITDTFGWRYCFKLNILPLIGIGYFYIFHFTNYNIVAVKKTDDDDGDEMQNQSLLLREKLGSIDFIGAFILALANLTFATTVLFGGNTREWTDPLIIATMVTTILSFILFGLYQAYWASSPLISRSCIANRNVMFSSLAYFFICMSNGSVDFTVPQFFMGVLGFSTSQSGLWTMMNALAVPIGCYCAGNYIRYQGLFRKWLLLSVAAYMGALLTMSCWMVSMIPFAMGIVSMVILGFGFGSSLVSLLVAVTSDVAPKDVASAMSIMMLFRSMGLLYGTAITSSIIQGTLKHLLETRINGPSAEQLVADVLGQSLQKAYLFMSLSCMVAIIPILYLKDTNLKEEQTTTGPTSKRAAADAAVVAVGSNSS